MPVRFDCLECRETWWSPPATGCPRCGDLVAAEPDPIIWQVGRVPGTRIFLSGQLRDEARFRELLRSGIRAFVDVAGARPYVWRPPPTAAARAGVSYTLVDGVEDTNLDLPDTAFAGVAAGLDAAAEEKRDVLLFCAAGLKRSPHLLYGVLLRRGLDPRAAWSSVQAARPMADPFGPYLAAAERWASRAD
jgi:hypothetical protein